MWKVNLVIVALASFVNQTQATVSTEYEMALVEANSWANMEIRANNIAHIPGQVIGQF